MPIFKEWFENVIIVPRFKTYTCSAILNLRTAKEMETMSKINVGFIGCGKIARVRHIPEASRMDGVHISGYYNRTREKAEDMAKIYGGQVYSTYQEVLDDPEVDAVVISVANILHGEITIEALKRGKHVLCEKPMATSLEESILMVETAKETGKVLNIAHNQRLNPVHQEAKRLLNMGAIGKVLTFRTTFGHSGPEEWSSTPGGDVWFFYEDAAGMGTMGDLGIHKTDLISYLLDELIIEVMATMDTLDKKGPSGQLITVDDNAMAIFKMSDGTMGTMAASWTYYGPEDNSTVLYGTQGTMYIYSDPKHSLKIIDKDGEVKIFEVDVTLGEDDQKESGVMSLFIEGILRGEETILSGKNILPAMRAIFACEESDLEQKRILIPENRREEI